MSVVVGQFSWANGRRLTFTPAAPLQPGRTYRVDLVGARTASGLILPNRHAIWRVAEGPEVGAFAWNEDSTQLTFQPATTLEPGRTYELRITNARDDAGRLVSFLSSFTVRRVHLSAEAPAGAQVGGTLSRRRPLSGVLAGQSGANAALGRMRPLSAEPSVASSAAAGGLTRRRGLSATSTSSSAAAGSLSISYGPPPPVPWLSRAWSPDGYQRAKAAITGLDTFGGSPEVYYHVTVLRREPRVNAGLGATHFADGSTGRFAYHYSGDDLRTLSGSTTDHATTDSTTGNVWAYLHAYERADAANHVLWGQWATEAGAYGAGPGAARSTWTSHIYMQWAQRTDTTPTGLGWRDGAIYGHAVGVCPSASLPSAEDLVQYADGTKTLDELPGLLRWWHHGGAYEVDGEDNYQPDSGLWLIPEMTGGGEHAYILTAAGHETPTFVA